MSERETGWLRVEVVDRRDAEPPFRAERLVQFRQSTGQGVMAWVDAGDVGTEAPRGEVVGELERVRVQRDTLLVEAGQLREDAAQARSEVERLTRERDAALADAKVQRLLAGETSGGVTMLPPVPEGSRPFFAPPSPAALAEGVWGPTPPGAAVVFDPGWDPQDARQRRAVAVAADGFARIDVEPVGEGAQARRATRVEVPWAALRALLAARDEDLAAGERR